MGVDDALDDRQAEADAGVVGADAVGAATERLDQRGHQLAGVSCSPVFSTVSSDGPARRWSCDPHRAVLGQVVDDRVVHEVRRHLQQQGVRADGRGRVAGGLDGDATSFGEREERFGGFLRDQGQVDGFSGE